MPRFGHASKVKLASLDLNLQAVLLEAIKYVDFTIVWAYRDEMGQAKAFAEGTSEKEWPDSLHNKLPSTAVDIAPYPKVYSEKNRVASAAEFSFLCGRVVGIADTLGIKLRWGGDWDLDGDTTDQKLADWGHLELTES